MELTPEQMALRSLDGLSTGDAFGQTFFGPDGPLCVSRRELTPGPWRWTDDTHMALSIVKNLLTFGRIKQDALAMSFAVHYVEDGRHGYGSGAREVLSRIYAGVDWRAAAPEIFAGGSYGNGAAMRAAPIGGFYAGQPETAAEQALLSAQITHAHPEGQAGAVAVAVAAALAAAGSPLSGDDLIAEALQYIPASETRNGITRAMGIPPEDAERAGHELGAGHYVSAQDTVPFCLWAAAHNLDDYERALWTTVSALGDRDTTCAIVGGIVALRTANIPAEWLKRREPLPSLQAF